MKRSAKLIVLLLIISITIHTCAAVEITLSKSSYQPGETLQAEIVGNFVDTLTVENIHLRQQGSPKSIPVEKELVFQFPKFYLYMTPLPEESEGISLQIEDTQYVEGGNLKSDDIVKEVLIQETGTPSISFNPGFVSAADDFTIQIKSLYGSQTINAIFEASGETQNFYAIEDVPYTLDFSISELETQTSSITLGGYTIPTFILHELPLPEENCSEQGGEICQGEWTCNQTETETIDTLFCCLGICEPPEDCVPDCINKTCGDDGCGGICGNCTTDFGDEFYCDSEFICINSTIPCIQRCNNTGELGCFGDYSKMCGNWDEDNCLEWGNSSLCEYGCENKICLTSPKIKELIFLSVSKTSPVLSARVIPNKDYPFQVVLENIGTEPLYNISIYTELGFVVSPSSVSLNPRARETINIFVNIDGTQVSEGDRLLDQIMAETDNLNFTFPIYLEITLEESNEVIIGTSITTSYTCADQNGVECSSGTECEKETITSSDVAACCTGQCIEPSSSSTAWIVGLLIIGIVVLFIVIGYVKSKKQPGSPKGKLEERTKKFEQRMRPSPTPTTGSLGKI